ncbi:MAG: hypothetical protein VCD00_08300, partial [Candidatus Hydrogenedentota bacterium]
MISLSINSNLTTHDFVYDRSFYDLLEEMRRGFVGREHGNDKDHIKHDLKNRHTKVVHVHHYSLRERLGRFYQNNRGIVNVSVLSVATLSIIIVAS